MTYETLTVRREAPACFVTLTRPGIDQQMVRDLQDVLRDCEETAQIVVLEGSTEVFCSGADFTAYVSGEGERAADPRALYDLWLRLARGPFVSIAHVRGKASAGGIGFVAACDIALADATAEFSLPELLFGLFPACVLPFLIRRIGFQKAHYLTITTMPVSVDQALAWGLVDAYDRDSAMLLRRHLMRLRHLSKAGVRRYKRYRETLDPMLDCAREGAVAANLEIFADPDNRAALGRFALAGLFPWEDI